MPANTVRPRLRILIAARDNGICQICGEPVAGDSAKAKRIKPNRIPTLPQGGEILSGDYPTIDHIYPQLGKTSGEQFIGTDRVYINLALAHKSCNVEKGDLQPSEKEKRAGLRPINKYVIKKADDAMKALNITESQITDRAEGRLMFRLIAQYLANKLTIKSGDFPF